MEILMNAVDNLSKFLSSFNDSSEVWIFQADRTLLVDEVNEMDRQLNDFVSQWDSHGAKLRAASMVSYHRFVIVIADHNNSPGGCSKDSMTQYIKKMGVHFQIDFFNRLKVIYRGRNGELLETNLADLPSLVAEGAVDENTIVYNNLVANKKALLSNWEVSIKDSWHNRFL